MQRLPILLCVSIAVVALCGLGISLTIAAPDDRASVKAGRFSKVKIDQREEKGGKSAPDYPSALDIYPSALDIYIGGKCTRAIQFFSLEPKQRGPRAYFNDAGQYYTNGWLTISGTMKGEGDDYRIEPPSLDPAMLYVWSDVIGPAIEVRTANTDDVGSYILQAMGRNGNYTFSIEQNGGLRWGTAKRADMDTNLYRGAPETLETDGSLKVGKAVAIGAAGPASTLHVGGSQSVQRTAVGADYAVTDADYYVGVADTSAPRIVTLPTASGKTGRVYVIKDESGAAGKHPITVKAQPGETVDGAASLPVGTNYGVLRTISNGKNWFGM
jgi:hypothetical protein